MDTMRLAVIGTDFHCMDANARGRVSFFDMKKLAMYERMEEHGVEQGVIVSTCNRSEIYFLYENKVQLSQMEQAYRQFFHLEKSIPFYSYQEREALIHLFEVCTGLRSMVVGEDQILAQLQESASFAASLGKMNKLLHKLFREAFTCAKSIKTALGISSYPLSVPYIGIQLLKRQCAIAGKRVLVVGAGDMAALVLRYLQEEKPSAIWVANRSSARLQALRKEFPAIMACPLSKRYERLQDCDLLITATSSSHPLIKKEALLPRQKPLYCLDLAIPQDIEPEVKEMEQVVVYTLDSLQGIAQENYRFRQELTTRAKAMIIEAVDACEAWSRSMEMEETIASLQQRCDAITQSTYALLERKLELTQRERYILHKTLQASFYRLMKEPFRMLKQVEPDKQGVYKEVVKQLFGMEEKT